MAWRPGSGRLLAVLVLALALPLGGCTYSLTPWQFNWAGDARCFDKGLGSDSRDRGTLLTLKIAPEDRSPVQKLELLIDADGRASYSTGVRVTSCLSFPMSDLEELDRVWANDELLALAPQACRPRVSLVDGGPLPERWNFRNCRPRYGPHNTDACRSAGVAMAGRAASSMRNVWLEFVGPGEESHLDFRWDLAAPLPELYEDTLIGTLNLLCARSGELAAALRERLPAGLVQRIDCRADDPARPADAVKN